MDEFIQIVVLALTAMVAVSALKKRAGEFSLLVTAVCIGALGVFAVTRLGPVLDLLRRLEKLTGVNRAIMAPALKAALVGILTNVAAGVCGDCGEGGVAKMVELCGTVMALYLSAPLVTAVLELLDGLLGG
ncbi:MAG: hypothetical protein HFF08_02635 [Oscillospiraceae bacterium]|jgi:stage III sporulation protein AD|nr:hypothetical protein [Oscillospiraceae bacterium]